MGLRAAITRKMYSKANAKVINSSIFSIKRCVVGLIEPIVPIIDSMTVRTITNIPNRLTLRPSLLSKSNNAVLRSRLTGFSMKDRFSSLSKIFELMKPITRLIFTKGISATYNISKVKKLLRFQLGINKLSIKKRSYKRSRNDS